MAKRIPAKQVVRAGNKSDLREKLIDRELGFEPTEFMLYVKYGDEIYPAGSVSIPAPGTNSVYMGKEDGSMDWADLPATPAPYDEELTVYESLDGVPFGAAFAYKDSEGNDIQMNVYYSPRVRERYGRLVLVNEPESHFVTVRMGERDSAWLGALLPTQAPLSDGTFRKGDILMVDGDFGDNGPMLNWKHPESDDVKNALSGKMFLATYGETTYAEVNAAITKGYIVALALGGDHFDYAYYAYSTDAGNVFRSTVNSDGSVTEYTVLYTGQWVTETVPVNKVFVATYGTTTYAEINQALANDQMVVLKVGGANITYAYYYRSTDASVEFQTLPSSSGQYTSYYVLYTGQWVSDAKDVGNLFVAEYGVTTKEELATAISLNKTIVMPSVSFGNDLVMDLVLASHQQFQHNPSVYTFTSGLYGDGSYGEVTLNSSGVWTKTARSLRGYNFGNIVAILGDESEQMLLTHVPCFKQAGYDFTLKVFSSANAEVIRMYSSEARTFRIIGRKHILRTSSTNPFEEWSNVDITLDVPSSSGCATFNLADHQAMIEGTTTVTLDAVIVVGGQTYGNLKITNYPSGGRHYMYASYDGLE